MKNVVSQHLVKHLGGEATAPGDRRRFDEFIRMLNERKFQLVNAIEGEADRFYGQFDGLPRFLFLFEAYRCSDPECDCLVYDETCVSASSDKDFRIAEFSHYLQRFVIKCKASGHKDVVPRWPEGEELPQQLVHGAWLVTGHPDRPADLSTHLLVPVGIKLPFGLNMIYDAVDSVFSPL
jgi:hypothetical protein